MAIMEVVSIVRSSKIPLLAVYCFVIVVTIYSSSTESSPIPQDAGGFQKPHFQVMKHFCNTKTGPLNGAWDIRFMSDFRHIVSDFPTFMSKIILLNL